MPYYKKYNTYSKPYVEERRSYCKICEINRFTHNLVVTHSLQSNFEYILNSLCV